jgi:hypothetical protein
VAFDLILEGTPDDVVDWIEANGVRLDPEDALAFHNLAVRPTELEWSKQAAGERSAHDTDSAN